MLFHNLFNPVICTNAEATVVDVIAGVFYRSFISYHNVKFDLYQLMVTQTPTTHAHHTSLMILAFQGKTQ